MLIVLGLVIAIPVVGLLVAFDAWHCGVRSREFEGSASESRRV